jgi:hypothetical protein
VGHQGMLLDEALGYFIVCCDEMSIVCSSNRDSMDIFNYINDVS